MNTGEPPGRNDIQAKSSDSVRSSKPVRIGFSFLHVDGGTGRTHVLERPLAELLHEAAAERTVDENGVAVRRSIGVVMGPISVRKNGHVRYSAIVAANGDKAEMCTGRLEAAIARLQETFKTTFEDLVVGPQAVPAYNASESVESAVPSDHETPPGHDEQRQSD